jgi:transcriptional regulator with XRE-family HTH domain
VTAGGASHCLRMRAVPSPVVSRLPALLERHGVTWGELARRTLLPSRLVARLRAPDANPRLAVAERVAAVLDVPIERIWSLRRR